MLGRFTNLGFADCAHCVTGSGGGGGGGSSGGGETRPDGLHVHSWDGRRRLGVMMLDTAGMPPCAGNSALSLGQSAMSI